MSQRTSRRTRKAPFLLRQGWCLLAILFLFSGCTTSACAEKTITAEAIADKGVFLNDAPRPAKLAGLCLVDTGVNVNPDTENSVVYRTAIDGGSGDDVSPSMHGTVLAMLAAAPANGWGMVGTAPQSIQIVSVRVLEQGQATFPFSSYATAISTCLELRKQYNIKVINLSLGSTETPSSETYEMVGDALQEAENYGVAIVAAAGNDDDGSIEYPAAYPGVLSVGASDTQTGLFCGFSNRGAGLRMVAPGCDLDGADPESGVSDYNYWQGTSESSDITADALTALMSYEPELTPLEAEGYLTEADRGVLDIAKSFRKADLEQIVGAGEADEPRPSLEPEPQPSPEGPLPSDITSTAPPPQNMATSSPMRPIGAFRRPSAGLRRTMEGNILILAGRPSEALTEARYLGHRHRTRRLRLLRTFTGTFTTLHIPGSVAEVSVRYTDPYDAHRTSPWTTLRLPSTGKGTRY